MYVYVRMSQRSRAGATEKCRNNDPHDPQTENTKFVTFPRVMTVGQRES